METSSLAISLYLFLSTKAKTPKSTICIIVSRRWNWSCTFLMIVIHRLNFSINKVFCSGSNSVFLRLILHVFADNFPRVWWVTFTCLRIWVFVAFWSSGGSLSCEVPTGIGLHTSCHIQHNHTWWSFPSVTFDENSDYSPCQISFRIRCTETFLGHLQCGKFSCDTSAPFHWREFCCTQGRFSYKASCCEWTFCDD